MQPKTREEAMFVACEMEKSAIELYTRALTLLEQLGRKSEPLYGCICQTLSDEREHLRRFSAHRKALNASVEHELLLSAVAEGLLFEGGLMSAARAGLLKGPASMLRFAARAEVASARKYREFARLCTEEDAKEALLAIAAEEDKHLQELTLQCRDENAAD